MDRICLFSMRVFIAGAWNPQGVRLMAGEATGEQFQFFKEDVLGLGMKLGELAF